MTRKDAQYDDEVDEALRKWNDEMQRWSNDGSDIDYPIAVAPFKYMNYAAPFQDPLASYGEMGLQWLRQVSKKYDPDQVFQDLVPGGFGLDRG